MPVGQSVQVATRSGRQLVRVAPAEDDVLVGLLPLGASGVVGQNEEILEIERGDIPFDTAITAPIHEATTLASFIPQMRKYHHHTYGGIVDTRTSSSGPSWSLGASERNCRQVGGRAHHDPGHAQEA